jgi:hypothetical protein
VHVLRACLLFFLHQCIIIIVYFHCCFINKTEIISWLTGKRLVLQCINGVSSNIYIYIYKSFRPNFQSLLITIYVCVIAYRKRLVVEGIVI